MRPFPRTLLLAATVLATGCNDGDVTKGGSVPPIAGVVGGPDAPGGTGQVGVEIRADAESVVPETEIRLENLDRSVLDGVAEVPAEPVDFVHLKVQGDVGDELRVTLEHPTEGVISRDYVVTPPKITEVRDPEGLDPVIHAGAAAQITGSGFCAAAECNVVVFDSTHVAILEEARPGLLFFMVPAAADVGTHTVRVAVAGTEGADEDYVSAPFTVTLEP